MEGEKGDVMYPEFLMPSFRYYASGRHQSRPRITLSPTPSRPFGCDGVTHYPSLQEILSQATNYDLPQHTFGNLLWEDFVFAHAVAADH